MKTIRTSEKYRDLHWSYIDDRETEQIFCAYRTIRDWHPGMSHESAWEIVERWLLKSPKSAVGRCRREASLKFVAEELEKQSAFWQLEVKKRRAAGKLRELITEYRTSPRRRT